MLTPVLIDTRINPQLQAFLSQLESYPWFENVAERLNQNEVKQVFSWREAWTHLQDESWANARVHEGVDSWHEGWDIAYDKTLQVTSQSLYCHEFEPSITSADAAAYDVASAAVEIARSQPAFFTDLMKWYVRGHFPCGWEGEYPLGKLIVY